MRATARTVVVGAAAAALAVALAACSSSTSPSTSSSTAASSTAASTVSSSGSSGSTSYPAGKEQVCQARDQLKTSISALTNPSLLVGGAAAIKAAVDQVQTDLSSLVSAGTQDYEPQVNAMRSSLQELQTAVGNLGNGNMTENLQAVGRAIAATGTASGDLFTQLKAACGS